MIGVVLSRATANVWQALLQPATQEKLLGVLDDIGLL